MIVLEVWGTPSTHVHTRGGRILGALACIYTRWMTLTVIQKVLVSMSPKSGPRPPHRAQMEPKISHFSSLFREIPLFKLIFKLDIWFQHGKFTMNSYYPKLGDRHFNRQTIL